MNTTRIAFLVTALVALAGSLSTAQPPSDEAGAAPATPDPTQLDVASDDNAESDETKPLREQTIYIPYSKLRATFEQEGRGVFLPYKQFQELWKQARSRHERVTPESPPVAVLLTEAENVATVNKDVVVVQARLQLEILKKGWHEVPLRLKGAAIRSARLGNEPARISFDPETGYKLLVKSDGDETSRLELQVEYAKAFSKAPGQNSVAFQSPQAPVNRWRITIPQSGVKVNIHPLIAATEVVDEAAEAERAESDDGAAEDEDADASPAPAAREETVILAFVGAAPEVRIDWTPKAEGAAGLDALASVQAEQEVSVEEGVVRTRVRLDYAISRAEVSQLKIEIPADHKVTGVFDPNVRQWEVAAEADRQTVSVQLFEPTRGQQKLTVELERFADVVAMREVVVPVVRALDVGRQQGVVVVRLADELQAQTSRRSGLLQLDAAELPATLKQGQWMFAYRYATLPFDLALTLSKVQPQIRTVELVEAYVEPQQLTIDLLALFDIQRAGVFQLELEIPSGYSVRQLRGQAAAGAEAALVDTHHLEGENQTRLRINLGRKATGRVGLFLELQKSLEDDNLLTPTGEISEIPLVLPRVATKVEHTSGRLIVHAPESLRVNPRRQAGARTISFAEALQDVQSLREGRFPGLRQVFALAYSQAPVDLTMNAERRKPYVTARQLLTAQIESGVVRYQANFFFDVQYSAVKSLRIDVPESLATDIRNQTGAIRKTVLDPQPDDVAEGYVAWSFTGESELLGSAAVRLAWEHKGGELEIGKSAEYELPVLQPMDVDRAWGQIVVTKAETLEVLPQPDFVGLRPIDPRHDLMQGVQVADAARAFEFHDNWSLTLKATRYKLEDVKRTSIERAVLRMVVTRSDRIVVQALYRLRSAVQRLAVQLPEGVEFDTDPLRINGRPVALESGDQDEMYVPLVGQNPEQSFLLELRYTVAGNFERLEFPVFPSQPPIQSQPSMQKVYLCVYLPDEMALLGSEGPWTNEQKNWLRESLRRLEGEQSDDHLINWVIEDVGVSGNPGTAFATDGTLYVFSTLQPPAPDEGGSLQLVATSRIWLNAVVFGGLALIALVFVRTSPLTKLVVLTLIVIALVLSGVFVPTFAICILDVKLFVAVALVVLVWLVAMAVPKRSAVAAAIPSPPEEYPLEVRESFLGVRNLDDVPEAEVAPEPDASPPPDSPFASRETQAVDEPKDEATEDENDERKGGQDDV